MPVILTDSPATIKRKIAGELFRVVNSGLKSIEIPLKNDIRDALQKHIVGQPEYPSLRFGTLRAHFGLPAGSVSERVDEIIEAAVSTVSLTNDLKVSLRGITGSLTITAIDNSYSNLLGLSNAVVVSEKGTPLPWLSWLLTFGDSGIVEGYDVRRERGKGRSGLAVMVIVPQNTWGVPERFSGRVGNNWFSRAVGSLISSGDLERVIKSRLQSL